MQDEAYWANRRRRHLTRRQLAGSIGSAGLGLAGAALLGCTSNPGKQQAGQTGASQASAGAPQLGGTYNAFFNTDVGLDPQQVSHPTGDTIASAAMSRPFRFKTSPDPNTIYNHDAENDLGVSAESPDAITWTVKLRPDATFQNVPPVNGHPLEAEDVKATFVRALKLSNNPNRGALGMIDPDQIQAPSRDTVVFKLKYPYAPFIKTLASPVYSWIFPREALAGSYDPTKQMIGSGPFTLESHTPDVEYVLKKSPTWFEKGHPSIDNLHFAIIPDTPGQLAQFTSGHLDEVVVLANDLETMKRNNPKALVLTVLPQATGNIYMQLGDPTSVFLDERVRRGLSLALDRDAIAKSVFGNQYVDMLFVPANEGKWALRVSQLDAETGQNYKYTPAESKRLLQEAGVLSQTFKWTYTGSADANRNPEQEAMLNMLTAVGLKTASVQINFVKDYLDAGKGYRQGYYSKDTILYGQQQPFTEVDEFLFGYFHSKSTQNQEHLNDPAIDAMIDRARTLVNEDERLKASLDIQRYIAKKLYIVNAGGQNTFRFVQSRVQNFSLGTTMSQGVETYTKVWLRT